MTAPKKPRAVKTVPAPELTAAQLRVAHLFASMTEEAQAGALPIIEAWAAHFSRNKRPALRLVGGGAK